MTAPNAPAPAGMVGEEELHALTTAAMRAFEPYSSVLRYREKDKWHACDIMGMREAVKVVIAPIFAEKERIKADRDEARQKQGQWAARAHLAEAALAPLAQEVERLRGDGWRDIASAPKDGSMILLYNVAHAEQTVMGWTEGVMEDVFEDGFWSDVGGRNAAITMSVNPNYFQFWCPLPAPPAAIRAGEK